MSGNRSGQVVVALEVYIYDDIDAVAVVVEKLALFFQDGGRCLEIGLEK